MSKNNTYNGWHNYATWRINLEIFDGMEIDEPYNWRMCKDYVEEILEAEIQGDNNKSLVLSYAFAFIDNVNWYEIAESLNEQLEESKYLEKYYEKNK